MRGREDRSRYPLLFSEVTGLQGKRLSEDVPAHPEDHRNSTGQLEELLQVEPVLALRTARGELTIVPEPAGTRRGYDDLRPAATREQIGHSLRPSVASVPDLARMMAALGREADTEHLRELRRIMEVEGGFRARSAVRSDLHHPIGG